MLIAPYPYFGGKRRVAAEIWSRIGDVRVWTEPFAGSLAVTLARPAWHRHRGGVRIVNDTDGHVVNFWRSVRSAPEVVAREADRLRSESEQTAVNRALIACREGLTESLEADADYCDPVSAGRWCWLVSIWVGRGAARKDWRQLPSIGPTAGRGVLGSPRAEGHAGHLQSWMRQLAAAVDGMTVTCGDWSRVLTDSPLGQSSSVNATAGVLLDPPYDGGGQVGLHGERAGVAAEAAEWAFANGERAGLRIALCGYDGEHDVPAGWIEHAWKADGGYANASAENPNAERERVWFSPHCLRPQPGLFDDPLDAHLPSVTEASS